jgi:hypothetical protein
VENRGQNPRCGRTSRNDLPWDVPPEAVAGRLLGSVSLGMPVHRCDRPYLVPCDAPTELGDA